MRPINQIRTECERLTPSGASRPTRDGATASSLAALAPAVLRAVTVWPPPCVSLPDAERVGPDSASRPGCLPAWALPVHPSHVTAGSLRSHQGPRKHFKPGSHNSQPLWATRRIELQRDCPGGSPGLCSCRACSHRARGTIGRLGPPPASGRPMDSGEGGELIAGVWTPRTDSAELIERAYEGELEAVRRLLEAGVDVNGTNANGATALHRAAYGHHLEVVQALVASGASLDMRDHNFGSTPLHAAAVSGATSVVNFLVKSGADLHSKNTAGKTPMALAEEQANIDVIAVLRTAAREERERQQHHKKLCLAMVVAVKQAQPDEVSRLLQEGADVNWEPLRGRTALVEAAERNHVAVMEVLVAAKAELDRADATGSTALMVAANYGSAAATQFLLRKGADDSLTDDFGRTALAIAKDHKKTDVVRTLQQWMAGQIDSDSPMPMGRGPAPPGRTHQRWPSQVRDLPVGFLIADGRLPSDVGPPIRSIATEGTTQPGAYWDAPGRASAAHGGYRTATLSDRSSLDHAYAPSVWDAGGAGGLLVQTALEICDTESETTYSRGTQSREAQRSRGSVSSRGIQSREAQRSRGSVSFDLGPPAEKSL